MRYLHVYSTAFEETVLVSSQTEKSVTPTAAGAALASGTLLPMSRSALTRMFKELTSGVSPWSDIIIHPATL